MNCLPSCGNPNPGLDPTAFLVAVHEEVCPDIFLTRLPNSDGNTCILAVVDHFSKAAHFIPLPKLPAAKQTAELMVPHLNARIVGPFSISKVINPCFVRLSLPLAMRRINPIFHVSQVKPLVSRPLYPSLNPILLPGLLRRLLKVRRRGRGLQYLVDWEGYDPEEHTWVPTRFIMDRFQQYPEAGVRGTGGTATFRPSTCPA